MKKVFIKTFGCQMNVRDSEVICGLLVQDGYELTDDPQKADVIILNTCSVRQHAEDRVFSLIGEYTKTKGQPPQDAGYPPIRCGGVPNPSRVAPLVGIVGCMAKNYGEKIFDKSSQVDFAVGPQDIEKIPEIINRLLLDKSMGAVPLLNTSASYLRGQSLQYRGDSLYLQRKIWETDGDGRPEKIYHTGFYEDKRHAYVIISEGCSNFCSYCIVPYVRGPIRHRNHKDILSEINLALGKGVSSVTLLGQNVNSYKYGEINFIKLLEKVNRLEGLKSLNFMTSHPKDASVSLFKALSDLEKIEKSLHLPMQSGSDRILKLMNRGYTVKNYLELADNYRKIVKGGRITTDIIVGFPTESETDFTDTFNLFKRIGFSSAFIFKYSPRPNTAAFKMNDDVAKKEKERRHTLMLRLQKSIFIVLFLLMPFLGEAYALNIDKVKVHFLGGNYSAAVIEANRLISEDQYSPELYYFLGLSYLKLEEYTKAGDSFRIVINNFKESKFKEEARVGLADTYLLTGDLNNAGNIYRELLADNPGTKFKSQINQRLGVIEPGKKGQYSVQVGSFANSNNARKLTYRLISMGYPAYIEEDGAFPNKSYKVRVGSLKTLSEAEDLGRKLSSQGYPVKVCP